MSAPLLAVEGLTKSFGGVRAVADVSFTLERGTLAAIIGANGAGKSTCFNMVGGQLKPDRGRIRLGGRDTTGLRPRDIWRLGLGRTFQKAATFGSMSVRENVQTALLSAGGALLRPFGWAGRSERTRADALLDLVGLGSQAARSCGELAYGDVKRLEVAMVLASRPSLLLMDEPTAGMAPGERADLMRLVAQLARERDLGVLFTEHDMNAVFGHADTVIVFDRGRIVAQGAPAAIRADPVVGRIYLGEGVAD